MGMAAGEIAAPVTAATVTGVCVGWARAPSGAITAARMRVERIMMPQPRNIWLVACIIWSAAVMILEFIS